MEHTSSNNRQQPPPGPFTIAWFAMWLTILLENIARIFQGERSTNRGLGASSHSTRPLVSSSSSTHYSERRSIISYINSGLSKVERARRSAAVGKQFGNSMRTIKLTKKAIRSSARQTRQLFAGYLEVLNGSGNRLKALFNELRETERHLKTYDVHAIEDEIMRMERTAPGNPDISQTIAARRELLETVKRFDARWADIANQIASISATLELNHLRILSIVNGPGGGDTYLKERLDEATEQIAVLEETLRELA